MNCNNLLSQPSAKDCLFWNRFWSESTVLHPLGQKPSELLEQFPKDVPKAGCILEIGIGDGRNLPMLMNKADHFVGIDISENAVSKVGSRIILSSDATVLVGSGYNLPMPDESCDLVVATDLMNHLDEPEQFCSEVWRVLKRGGRFIGNAMSIRDSSRANAPLKGVSISPNQFSFRWNGVPKLEPVWLTMHYYENEDLKTMFEDFVWIEPPSEYGRKDLGHPAPFDPLPHQHVFWKVLAQKP